MTDAADFTADFLTPAGVSTYVDAVTKAAGYVAEACSRPTTPGLITGADELRRHLSGLIVGERAGVGLPAVLAEIAALVAPNSTAVSDPRYAAHLHCPPTISSLAAETVLCGLNQSMDSYDQGPAAAIVEESVVQWLCSAFGIPGGDGVFTSGGTQSNLQALLLARDNYAARNLGIGVAEAGLPEDARRWRIVCTEDTHFTVATSARLLGLGTDCIRHAEMDPDGRLEPNSLAKVLDTCRARDEPVIAVVLTAGTTNRGAVDPLRRTIDITAAQGIWTHVDAAAGGCLAFTDRHRWLLDGIAGADSISVDFHKLLFQSISCGALLLRNPSDFDILRQHVDYLNPPDDDPAETVNLVGKSLQTTRRFDALKVLITLRALGIDAVAGMIDATLLAAAAAAAAVSAHPRLQLLSACQTNTVLLRWAGPGVPPDALDALNTGIRERLAAEKQALIGRTRADGEVALKLTFVNPVCTVEQARGLVEQIAECGDLLSRRAGS